MTVRVARCCRANCSTPGASARQAGQCGAQNHTRVGLSDGMNESRATDLSAVTSWTVIAGSGLEEAPELGSAADLSLPPPPHPASTIAPMTSRGRMCRFLMCNETRWQIAAFLGMAKTLAGFRVG